jgi:hypothetical protein
MCHFASVYPTAWNVERPILTSDEQYRTPPPTSSMPPITRLKEKYQQHKLGLEQEIQRSEAVVARKRKKYEKLSRKRWLEPPKADEDAVRKAYQVVAQAEKARLSLSFKLLCVKLRENDPSVTSLNDSSEFVDGHDEALGEALQRNTYISSLSIYWDMLRERRPISKQFLHFASTSKFLASVSLNGHPFCSPSEELVDPFLCAIASNPSINEVALDFSLAPKTLATFVRHARTLRRLTIDYVFEHWEDDCQYSKAVLAEAFSGAETLQSLTLLLFTDKLLPVLEGLLNRRSSLQEFKLIMRNGCETSSRGWETACQFIHSSPSLEHLELGSVAFKTEWMEKLVHPFMVHDGTLCPLLSKLVLRECRYSPGACAALVSFMQFKVHIQQQQQHDTSAMALRELVLDGDSGHYNSLGRGRQEACLGQYVYPMISAMPLTTIPTRIPTIGSQVQTLTLHNYHRGFAGLLDAMGQNACDIRHLQRLELYGMEFDNFEELARNMPSLTFVKSLGLGAYCYHRQRVANLVLHMLRENDHVCSLSVLEEKPRPNSMDRDPRFLDAAQFRLAQAYCKRNVNLAKLWKNSTDCLYLYPSLLQATKHVSRQHFLLCLGLMTCVSGR